MTLIELACEVVEAAESTQTDFMAVGAIASGVYGLPRSTRDFDLLVSIDKPGAIDGIITKLEDLVDFDPQIVFDTITFGSRHVGKSKGKPSYKVELFETFDDPFVKSEFSRRTRIFVPVLDRETWIPTAEDVLVQKLRWARPKDLEDVKDVLTVQGTKSLDMDYIKQWCEEHKSTHHPITWMKR